MQSGRDLRIEIIERAFLGRCKKVKVLRTKTGQQLNKGRRGQKGDLRKTDLAVMNRKDHRTMGPKPSGGKDSGKASGVSATAHVKGLGPTHLAPFPVGAAIFGPAKT